MAAAHSKISTLTVTRDMWGKSSRRKSTTNRSAVQHLPNHLAPFNFLPYRSLMAPMTSMKPSFSTNRTRRSRIRG